MSSARGPQLIHRDPEFPRAIPGGEVRVWVAGIDELADFSEQASSFLSADEQAKINRFRFEADKRRSTVARTLLRSVLGTVTGTHPGKLTFDYGEFGKPVLRGGGPDFNLSHSNETVALAVGNTGPIGIDVESVNRTVDPVPLSRTCFSVVEQQALASLADAPTRLAAFFRGWTRKEAFIKALGYGLQAPLDQFDVRLDQDPGNTLLACRLEHTTQAQWQVLDLQLTQNRPAAITVNQAATQTIVVSDVGSAHTDALLSACCDS